MTTQTMTPLQLKIYTLLQRVPEGMVTTYKELAKAAGTNAYRAVGQFMRHNPRSFMTCTDQNLRIPCHRVVASDGSIGGFIGDTHGIHIKHKISLLKLEGIHVRSNKIVHFTQKLYTFPA